MELINTPKQISDLMDELTSLEPASSPGEPFMYIDLEGVDLCREGSLSILTLLIRGDPTERTCLIDIHALEPQAFDTAGTSQKTLKDNLQDENVPKVFSTFVTIRMPCSHISELRCRASRMYSSWKVLGGVSQMPEGFRVA